MTDIQIAHEIDAVKKLPFVSDVTNYDRGSIFIVALISELVKYMPKNRRAINFMRADFCLQNVIEGYKSMIVDHLCQGLAITENLLMQSQKAVNVSIQQ